MQDKFLHNLKDALDKAPDQSFEEADWLALEAQLEKKPSDRVGAFWIWGLAGVIGMGLIIWNLSLHQELQELKDRNNKLGHFEIPLEEKEVKFEALVKEEISETEIEGKAIISKPNRKNIKEKVTSEDQTTTEELVTEIEEACECEAEDGETIAENTSKKPLEEQTVNKKSAYQEAPSKKEIPSYSMASRIGLEKLELLTINKIVTPSYRTPLSTWKYDFDYQGAQLLNREHIDLLAPSPASQNTKGMVSIHGGTFLPTNEILGKITDKWEAGAGVSFWLNENLSLDVDFNIQKFKRLVTNADTDTFFVINPPNPNLNFIRMNGNSFQFNYEIGLRYFYPNSGVIRPFGGLSVGNLAFINSQFEVVYLGPVYPVEEEIIIENGDKGTRSPFSGNSWLKVRLGAVTYFKNPRYSWQIETYYQHGTNQIRRLGFKTGLNYHF